MSTSTQTVFRLLALCAAGAASYWLATRAADELELRTAQTVLDVFNAESVDWAAVEIDGLIVRLQGEAPDEAARFKVIDSVGGVLNPTNISDEMTVRPMTEIPDAVHRLEILRVGGQITVHGLLPGGEATRTGLFEALGRIDDGMNVSDLLSSTNASIPSKWAGAIDVALVAAAELDNVRISIDDGDLVVEGLATDRSHAQAVRRKLREVTPKGLFPKIYLQLPRQLISPFVVRAQIEDDNARLESCMADDAAGLQLILDAAERADLLGTGNCIEALGAPHTEWSRVTADAIDALAQSGGGTVTVSDLTITLVPAIDAPVEKLSAAVTALENTLPEVFTLNVLTPEGGAVIEGEGRVSFSATRSPEGLVNVRGPLPDGRAREVVESYASAVFGSADMHHSLRQQPGLPDGWVVAVLAGLEAFSRMETGSLEIVPGKVTVRGTTGDPNAEAEIAQALTAALGTRSLFDLEVSYLERLDPVAEGPTPQECVDEVNDLLAQDKITFPPGAVDLSANAMVIIERIAKLLLDCPETQMEIAGYTDSQGREEMNRALSQGRADSVFNALLGHRVLSGNLSSVGYGEDSPVADNNTSEGREANRRIEFHLLENTADQSGETSGDDADEAEEESENGQE